MSDAAWDFRFHPYPERADLRESIADRIYAALEWPVARLAHARGTTIPARDRSRALALDLACVNARAIWGEFLREGEYLAARAMLEGRLVQDSPFLDAGCALALAAAASALCGDFVHVLHPGEARAASELARFAPLFSRMRLDARALGGGFDREQRRETYACAIVYAGVRDVAMDYLRDRVILRDRPGPVRLRAEALLGEGARSQRLLLRGLGVALLADADRLLVDEAEGSVAIAFDGDPGQRHRLFQEALAIGGELVPGLHYLPVLEGCPRLTDAGRLRLVELADESSGLWAGAGGREELMRLVLAARPMVQGQDYEVRGQGIALLPAARAALMARPEEEALVAALLATREFSSAPIAREAAARVNLQRFLGRYVRLAGTCVSAQGIRRELWRRFRLRIEAVPGLPPARRAGRPRVRIYPGEAELAASLAGWLYSPAQAHRAMLVAMRSPDRARRLSETLTALGRPHRCLLGTQDEQEMQDFAAAAAAPGVTILVADAADGARLRPPCVPVEGIDIVFAEGLESPRHESRLLQRCALPAMHQTVRYALRRDDDLLRPPGKAASDAGQDGAVVERGLFTLRWRQWRESKRAARRRRDLRRREDEMGDVLSFAGSPD